MGITKLDFRKWLGGKKNPKPTIEEQADKEDRKTQMISPIKIDMNTILLELMEEIIDINKINVATKLAIEENRKKEEKTDEEWVPKEYHEYLDVFSEEKAAQFPESKLWDHKIKMKEGFEPKSFKNYNLTLAEQSELNKSLKRKI